MVQEGKRKRRRCDLRTISIFPVVLLQSESRICAIRFFYINDRYYDQNFDFQSNEKQISRAFLGEC